MNRIINIAKFKEQIRTYSKADLSALLFEWSFQRILCELVMVNAINTCRKNGEIIPKTETLATYSNTIDGERAIIEVLGRREAARVYGRMAGVTSDVKMVDQILNNNAVPYYEQVIAERKRLVANKQRGGENKK